MTNPTGTLIPESLPTLTGSEKQVKWAEDIRTKKLTQWQNRVQMSQRDVERTDGGVPDPRSVSFLADEAPLIAGWLTANVWGHDDAKFWIDNRTTNFLEEATLALRFELRAIKRGAR